MANYENRYDDGEWYVGTLGHFVELLIDAGQDVAVRFRVVEDAPPDGDGLYTRKMEIVLLPDGYVAQAVEKCSGIHKTLKMLLEAGTVT